MSFQTSVPPPEVQKKTPFQFIGCFYDQPRRAMQTYNGVKTITECADTAMSKYQTYFGMQYPQGFSSNPRNATLAQCFTDNSERYKQYGNAPCGNYIDINNKNAKLGGPWINAVYKIKYEKEPFNNNTNTIYEDPSIQPDFKGTFEPTNNSIYIGDNMTIEQCRQEAINRKKTFFAMQNPPTSISNTAKCYVGDKQALTARRKIKKVKTGTRRVWTGQYKKRQTGTRTYTVIEQEKRQTGTKQEGTGIFEKRQTGSRSVYTGQERVKKYRDIVRYRRKITRYRWETRRRGWFTYWVLVPYQVDDPSSKYTETVPDGFEWKNKYRDEPIMKRFEIMKTVPKYKTVNVTKEKTEPIYKDEKVYRTEDVFREEPQVSNNRNRNNHLMGGMNENAVYSIRDNTPYITPIADNAKMAQQREYFENRRISMFTPIFFIGIFCILILFFLSKKK
jgi:hypothetical protein